jgi:hypothetical protein
MATRTQKIRSLERAYEIARAYARSGDINLKFTTVLEDMYQKLVELEEDADKEG